MSRKKNQFKNDTPISGKFVLGEEAFKSELQKRSARCLLIF
jgi:hypothetical protein